MNVSVRKLDYGQSESGGGYLAIVLRTSISDCDGPSFDKTFGSFSPFDLVSQ